jgi:hypothetical protein
MKQEDGTKNENSLCTKPMCIKREKEFLSLRRELADAVRDELELIARLKATQHQLSELKENSHLHNAQKE